MPPSSSLSLLATAAALTVTTTSLLAALSLYRKARALSQRLADSEEALRREHLTRIRAQKKMREMKELKSEGLGPDLPAIGEVKTMFTKRFGTPRQGSTLAPSTVGVLRVNPKVISARSLSGLAEYSHVWLLFIFHENTNEHKLGARETHRATVHPPGADGKKAGVFATRTPHRPSRLGLSLVKVVSVDDQKGELVVSGIDLLDGTPIVDVKPLVPFDLPTLFGYHYRSNDSSTTDVTEDPYLLRFPKWVTEKLDAEMGDARIKGMKVRWSPEAEAGLRACLGSPSSSQESGTSNELDKRRKTPATQCEEARTFFRDAECAMRAIDDCLRLDVRAVHQGRYKGEAREARYEELNLFFAKMRLTFKVVASPGGGEEEVLVVACRPAEEAELEL